MNEILILAVILTNLRLLTSSRMSSLITWAAAQGILLGLFAVVSRWEHLTSGVVIVACLAILLKGYVFPLLLLRARRAIGGIREDEPYVGYNTSMLIGLVALAGSLWVGSHLGEHGKGFPHLIVPATLFSVFSGLFLIISRKKAIAQVIGFLAMENGAFMLGVGTLYYAPFLVELGVLLDMFAAVLILAIIIRSMHRAFRHMDTHQLSKLKG